MSIVVELDAVCAHFGCQYVLKIPAEASIQGESIDSQSPSMGMREKPRFSAGLSVSIYASQLRCRPLLAGRPSGGRGYGAGQAERALMHNTECGRPKKSCAGHDVSVVVPFIVLHPPVKLDLLASIGK